MATSVPTRAPEPTTNHPDHANHQRRRHIEPTLTFVSPTYHTCASMACSCYCWGAAADGSLSDRRCLNHRALVVVCQMPHVCRLIDRTTPCTCAIYVCYLPQCGASCVTIVHTCYQRQRGVVGSQAVYESIHMVSAYGYLHRGYAMVVEQSHMYCQHAYGVRLEVHNAMFLS